MRINHSITDFLCNLGVRQGCPISPGFSLPSTVGIFLFMYADDIALNANTSVELHRELKALESFCQKWGMQVNLAKAKVTVFMNDVKVSPKEKLLCNRKTTDSIIHYKYLSIVFNFSSAVGIFLLMYGNDIAPNADTSVELQRELKALESFYQKWGMQVNLAKAKVIVFMNNGKVSSKDKLLCNGKTIDISTHYKYLGIVLNSKLTWRHVVKELTWKANEAVSMIRHVM